MENHDPDNWYIEPFVGGANLIDKVSGKRLGNDINWYLIEMLRALQEGWTPPKDISEQEYSHIKNNMNLYPPELVAYVGFNSYGAKWFGGYRRDSQGKRNYFHEHYRNVMKQAPKLKGIIFTNLEYYKLRIPLGSTIYCDPPYKHTVKYKDDFDHDKFWEWCRAVRSSGYNLYISEYSAPEDFTCIWEKKVNNTLDKNTGGKQGVERLFK